MMNFTSSGLALKRIDITSEFTPTDLPAPVAPAISRCGIFARSATYVPPSIVLPRAIVSRLFLFSIDATVHANSRPSPSKTCAGSPGLSRSTSRRWRVSSSPRVISAAANEDGGA